MPSFKIIVKQGGFTILVLDWFGVKP